MYRKSLLYKNLSSLTIPVEVDNTFSRSCQQFYKNRIAVRSEKIFFTQVYPKSDVQDKGRFCHFITNSKKITYVLTVRS